MRRSAAARMTLLDTSGIVALANGRDPYHARAEAAMERCLAEGEELLIHNYIVAEAAAVLQRRIGNRPALAFLEQVASFEMHWLTPEDHAEAVDLFVRRNRRGPSLVDCASFVVMRRYGVTHALAFDPDFEREGFAVYGG